MNTFIHRLGVLVLVALAGCGGGGGGDSGGGDSASTPEVVNTDTCGAASGAASGSDNVLPVKVASCGLVATGNMPYVDVTLCAPGSSTDCKTVGYVLLDTASYGLRIFSSALGDTPVLPKETDGSGNDLFECTAFVSGYMWGNVRLADVKLGGLTASSLPVQIVADPDAPLVPGDCSDYGADMGSVRQLGANGILGVGPFVEDWGDYYTCSGSTCTYRTVAAGKHVSNPVAALPGDNNGVILAMPAVSASGAATATGSLIFGIGTRSNNALGSATVLDLDNYGNLTTLYGTAAVPAFVDSGSNGLFFDDATIPTCTSGWYCPSKSAARAATLVAASNGAQVSLSFEIANASTLFATGNTAFDNLGAPWDSTPSEFDWGMPFFYGRQVYFAIEGRTADGSTGPYLAF